MVAIATTMRRELRRFNLTLREHIVAEALLDLSLERGVRSCRIQKLDDLVGLTGFSRGDISRTLAQLERTRILQKSVGPFGITFQLLPDSRYWQARVRIDQTTASRSRENILAAMGTEQLELVPCDAGLTEALALTSLEGGARAVVESTTAARCQIDNRRESPMFPGQTTAEPNSARSLPPAPPSLRGLEVQGSDVKGSELLNSEPLRDDDQRADELMDRMEEIHRIDGRADELPIYGGAWRNRARKYPDVLDRAIADAMLTHREGRIRNSIVGCILDNYKRWGGK